MRRSRTLVFAVVTAAAVALSGCSATVTGSPARTGASTNGGAVAPTSDPVEWTDKVCGSLLPFVQAVSAPPDANNGNPVENAKSVSTFLANTMSSIDETLTGLDAVGPSPIPDGDKTVTQLKSALTTIRASFDRAKTALDNVDPNNVPEVASTLPEGFTSLTELTKIQDTASELEGGPELKAAAAKAPNCQKINTAS